MEVMQEYFEAVRTGNEGEVLRLLDADPALLESIGQNGQTPLGAAATAGHLGMVGLLINRGANINATHAWVRTALHRAGHEGHEDVVALLLSKGAQANIRDDHGSTPLMVAAFRGHLCVVRMLVQHMGGVGLDGRNILGWTALYWTASRGHEEVVRYLLLAGSDPTIRDIHEMTPRAVAQQRGHSSCVAVFEVRQHMSCTHPPPHCILLYMYIVKQLHALSTAPPSGGLASPPLTLTCFF
jgi:serine/threonine-protein phosphatase 6 regulatory ankyrin repeat subunit B